MRLGFILIAFLLSFSLSAQRKSRVLKDSIPNWSITFSPSALLNQFSGIQFGIEKRFSNRWAAELEYAYIFPQDIPGLFFDNNDELQKSGFRGKLGVKRRRHKGLHFLFTLYLRRTVHDMRTNFSRFDGAFNEVIDYQTTKTLIGPAFGISWELPFGKRIIFDLGGSTGFGNYRVRRSELPSDAVEFNDLFADEDFGGGFNGDGDNLYPILALHVKIKFRLN